MCLTSRSSRFAACRSNQFLCKRTWDITAHTSLHALAKVQTDLKVAGGASKKKPSRQHATTMLHTVTSCSNSNGFLYQLSTRSVRMTFQEWGMAQKVHPNSNPSQASFHFLVKANNRCVTASSTRCHHVTHTWSTSIRIVVDYRLSLFGPYELAGISSPAGEIWSRVFVCL